MVIIGSSNPVAIKFALNYGWPPIFLGIFRMAIIGIIVLIWIILRDEQIIVPGGKSRQYTAISSMCKGIGVIGFYLSLSIIPASRAIILATFSPVINLLMIHLFLEHEKARKNHILGIIVSFIGIFYLLFTQNNDPVQTIKLTSFFKGDILMMVSIVFHNGMVIYEKKAFNHGANPRQLIIWNNIVSKFEVSYINSFSHLGKALSIFYAIMILGEAISFKSILCFLLILFGTWIATRR